MTPPRLFIVGTDTEIGKTTVAAALLRAARARGQRWLPYKPAVSGDLGETSDHARLVAAVPQLGLTPEAITGHRFEPPISPGLAEDDHPFFSTDARDEAKARTCLEVAKRHLGGLVDRHQPDVVLIEGAGGLHVPMPGGTWLPEWIDALSATPLVVARAGLGTLNHTILTVEALRRLGHEVPAFVLNCHAEAEPPTLSDNLKVLEARLGIPCLGVHPHRTGRSAGADPSWLREDWLAVLGLLP